MNSDSQQILVTGATGFIGRNLLVKLIENKIRPSVLCRKSDKILLEPEEKANLEIKELDLLDFNRLEDEILEINPKIVVHLAGATRFDRENAEKSFAINYTATVRLLDILAKTDVQRIILIGTADEYGNSPTPFREEMETKPLSDYAISKNRANLYALKLFENVGLPIVILRIFTIYGYSQPKNMFLVQLIEHCLRNEVFEMTDGLQKRDYVYISDAARAIYKAIFAPDIEGKIINIGSGNSIRLRDVAEKVWEIYRADRNLLQVGKRFKPNTEGFDTQADITRAKKLLDWQPTIDFETGLREMIFRTEQEIFGQKTAS